nr:hypothetical protein [Oscillospiraceae bacterium]
EIYNKFINDDLLVMSCGFAGFDQIEFIERDVSDRIKFIGFPSETENYHIAVPTTSLSIFTKSKNQTGAFDFIKFCTSYEAYVDNTDGTERITHSHALPINRDALNFHYNWSIETNVLEIDENIKRSYCDEIMKQINSVNGSGNMTCNAIGDILAEELTSYFNGDKEPDEVCRIIQSRVTIYLSEQS